LALILLLYGLRELGRAPPGQAAKLMRTGFATVALAAAVLALLRGNAALALAFAGAAMLIAAGKSFRAPFMRFGKSFGASFGGNKALPDASVEFEFDNSGVRDGAILSGRFAGWKLSELSRVECEAFYAQCRATGSEALLAVEAYFDRRFPGWRAAAQDDSDAGRNRTTARNGEMTEQEAYQTLGLRPGARVEEIVRAHRTLMKERHPDHGGTTDDAARLNQAKDKLLRRHG